MNVNSSSLAATWLNFRVVIDPRFWMAGYINSQRILYD